MICGSHYPRLSLRSSLAVGYLLGRKRKVREWDLDWSILVYIEV